MTPTSRLQLRQAGRPADASIRFCCGGTSSLSLSFSMDHYQLNNRPFKWGKATGAVHDGRLLRMPRTARTLRTRVV